MNIFQDIAQKRKAALAKKRIIFLGQMFDTIDSALIKNKISNKDRMEHWLKFIGSQEYRKEFIQKMSYGLIGGNNAKEKSR